MQHSFLKKSPKRPWQLSQGSRRCFTDDRRCGRTHNPSCNMVCNRLSKALQDSWLTFLNSLRYDCPKRPPRDKETWRGEPPYLDCWGGWVAAELRRPFLLQTKYVRRTVTSHELAAFPSSSPYSSALFLPFRAGEVKRKDRVKGARDFGWDASVRSTMVLLSVCQKGEWSGTFVKELCGATFAWLLNLKLTCHNLFCKFGLVPCH